ncbi:LacI family transcriptional regulator [Acidaminobacter sp. JC074]|uniref:LacI family DNA-binding transcriptional regulator n=1 Tax=Acidaminobacter sp. JC074 TaxID=2530199 RepID=UPI001F105BB6|nr:LacI family DNA-binding transcriptional regulator [Acidaminobacter sp. JC074]MCH4888288.1 LacI family transcriptional regulator [Acidaminobacter sp. JC074]
MKSVNIKDIAKAAGVGVSTVSRVLNNQPDVKDSTKERVLKVIEELNYVPNNSARNLKRNKTNHIGIFIIGEYSNFFSKVVEAIEEKISNEKHALVLHFHKEHIKTVEVAVEFALEKRLAGLIILGGSLLPEDEGYIKQLDIPVVFGSTVIHEACDRDLYSSVTIDNFKSSYEGVVKLISSGHKSIGLISSEDGKDNVAERRQLAYEQALKDHALISSNELIAMGDYSMQSGYDAMKELLKTDLTAVFAISDLMAIGAVKAVFDAGKSVPDDISVVGFDGLEISKFMHPSLSTVEQPYDEMGSNIASIVLSEFKDKDVKSHIVLETTFYKGQTIKERGGQ